MAADLAALAACENVVAKVSGLITKDDWQHWTAERLRPVVDHALETFGPSRLMFGSDWPLAELAGGYGPWKDAYLQLTESLTTVEKAAIDTDNESCAYTRSVRAPMSQLPTRPLGSTGLQLTELSFGAASLGNLYRITSDDEATGAVAGAWELACATSILRRTMD